MNRAILRIALAAAATAALSLLPAPALSAGAPRQISAYPPDGMDRVPADATIQWVFDQPTAKSAIFSLVDLSDGGSIPTTLPIQWSPLGDIMSVKTLDPLKYGHLYGMKLNSVQDTSGTYWGDEYYPISNFTVIAPAKIERVSPANVAIALTPDVPMPVSIAVRETANTDAWFRSVRVQFLPSSQITNIYPAPLDDSVTPLYETTQPLSTFLPRRGVVNLEATANLPDAIARNIPQGQLGMRLTFYGTDEIDSSIVLDLAYRLDPTTVATHSASVVPAMASDLLIQSVVLESPVHGMVVAAGDTILPRATVIGTGTGGFRGAFYLDGDLVSIEEGYMEAGRPVAVEMRGPLPTRRFGEHRLQFQVESPQVVAANPISFTCAPPTGGLTPDPWTKPGAQEDAPPPSKLSGSVRWTAQGNSTFRGQGGSSVGWAGWRGGYALSQTRRLETDLTFRLRFDDTRNGTGKPQYMSVRYVGPSTSLEVSDAAPANAAEMPLLMSATPRRSAQARLAKTPIGEVSAYMTLDSHPISSGGSGVRAPESDLYAARISRGFGGGRARAGLYGGYTHEDPTAGGAQVGTQRRSIYGGMGSFRFADACSLLADAATVHHRALEGIADSRSRTAWRAQLAGRAAGIQATAQAFSYQPELATALNPYALSNRRGGMGEIAKALWKWRFFGNFRSEQPQERAGLEPIVRVNRSSVGGRLEMSPGSWVLPSIVRVTHRGANIDYVETRLATEMSTVEQRGGRTSARFDIATMEDERRPNTKRRITSGSFVNTGHSMEHVTSTFTAGVEWDRNRDLALGNTTLQGTFEARWEAIPRKLLITPFVLASGRDYKQQGTRESRYAARLQLAFLRVPGLGENAVSLEGRVDRLKNIEPLESTRTDGSVMIFVGQRFEVNSPR